MNSQEYRIVDNGDAAITIIFDKPVSEELSRKIIQLAKAVRKELDSQLIDIIPAYQSLTLSYQPLLVSGTELRKKVSAILEQTQLTTEFTSRLVEIPVCYQDEFAPDMGHLEEYCGLSSQEIIICHSQATYLIHMSGFLPGFLYLGGLSEKLHCPRKETPELKIPAGSVGIGGNQTGIYPVASPSGWHIIGRTPAHLFNPHNRQPFIASPLDRIKFVPIDKNEYYRLKKEIL